MRVLLLCNDFYHPGDVPIQGMEPLRKKGIDFYAMTNGADFDPGILKGYDVVIMSTSDEVYQDGDIQWKTDAVQEAFISYVESGGGLLVTHNGLVASDGTAKLDMLIGSRFTHHPDSLPVEVQMLKPHPVTEGVEPFCEVDEHYYIEILSPDVDILAAGYAGSLGDPAKYESEPYKNAPAKITPTVYVRTQGKGRVCALTPGHRIEVWLLPQFQKLLENAIRWCGGLA